jgi:hypothetical protein
MKGIDKITFDLLTKHTASAGYDQNCRVNTHYTEPHYRALSQVTFPQFLTSYVPHLLPNCIEGEGPRSPPLRPSPPMGM